MVDFAKLNRERRAQREQAAIARSSEPDTTQKAHTMTTDNKLTPAAPKTGGALASMPQDLVERAGQGTENIGAGDVKPPRLRICQAGSAQRKPDNPLQIQGLNELDMFNDLSGEIYGRGPLKFVVIAQLGSRGMQFAGDGKTIVDFDVPINDPRMNFTQDTNGKRVKPVATLFYDYVIWLVDQQEFVALSLSSSQIKIAKKLNSFLRLPIKLDNVTLPNPPAWARMYSFTTASQQDGTYSWGVYNLAQLGVTDIAVREQCAMLYDVFGGGKKIKIDHEDEHPDPANAGEAVNDPNTIDGESRSEPSDM
jgi:hypothetical protein